MVNTTVAAKVDPEKKGNLIKAAGVNGKSVNEVLNELIDNYLNDHDKFDHPQKYKTELPQKVERVEIVGPDDEEIELKGDEEEWGEEFLNEMWDSFVDYAKERGYTLIRTAHLRKILSWIKAKRAKESEPWECPCGYKSKHKFNRCPECGGKVEWPKGEEKDEDEEELEV